MALVFFTLAFQLFLPQHLSAYLILDFPIDPQVEDAKWEARLDLLIGSIEIPEPMAIETFLTKILSAISDFKFDMSDEVEGTVQLRLTNVALRDVLDAALTPKGFTWRRDGDTILVSLAIQSRVFPLTDAQLNRVKPMLEDPASLDRAERDLRRILFDQPGREEIPGREVFLNEETRTLTVRDTEEVIATVEAWLASIRDAAPPLQTNPEDAKWEAKLDQMIASFEIRQTDIETVLTGILEALSGFDFILDEGVEGNVEATMSNKTLREVLDMVLKPNGFIWRRERNTIHVSLQPQLKTRVFPLTAEELEWVQYLLYLLEQPELTDYPQLDPSVERNCDSEAAADARFCLNREKKTLVVRNTDNNIAKVEAWLKKVRVTIDIASGSTAPLPWTSKEIQDQAQQDREEGSHPEESGRYRTHIFSLTPESFDRAKRVFEQLDTTGVGEMELRRIVFGKPGPATIPGRELLLNEDTHTLIVRDTEENIAKAETWVAMLEDIVTGDGLVYWSITLDPEIAAEVYELARRYLVEEVGGGEEAYQQAEKKISLDGKSGGLVILDTPENIDGVKRIILAKPVSKRGILKARVFHITENTDTDPASVKKRLQLLKDVVDELRILLYEREGETEEEANARGRRIFYPENEEQEQRDPRFIGTITVVDTSENIDQVKRYLAERDTRISIEARILILSSSLQDDLGISGDWSLFSPTRLAEFLNSVSTDENAEVRSWPKITARDGQNASVSTPLEGPVVSTISLETRGDDEPISQNFEIEWPPLHYLEWVGTGQYRVVAVEKDDLPAIVLSATPVIIEESIFLDLELQVKELKSRLPLPDAPDLHAGRPIFETHTISTKLKMKNRETAVASLFNQKDSHGNEFTTVIAITVEVLPGKRLTRAPTSAGAVRPGASAGHDSR